MSISGSEFRSGSGFTCTNKDELLVECRLRVKVWINGFPEADYSEISASWGKSLGFSADFWYTSLRL
jgi:hypothetical protein